MIRARFLARKFDLDVQGLAVRNAVPPNIGLAVVADVYEGAVFRVELADRVVPGDAAVLTEGCDYLVLKYGFGVNKDRLPGESGDLVSLWLVSDSPVWVTQIESIAALNNIWVVFQGNLFCVLVDFVCEIFHIRKAHFVQTVATGSDTVVHG